MNKISLHRFLAGALLAIVSHGAMAQGNVTLPAPEVLVTMSIQQRLELMQSMNALPAHQRDANLKALREEIDSLSPNQKQEMATHFQAEFKALPPDEQEKLRAALAAAHNSGQPQQQ